MTLFYNTIGHMPGCYQRRSLPISMITHRLSRTKSSMYLDLSNVGSHTRLMVARQRKKRYRSALLELATLLSMVFGVTTILMWAFVIDHKSIILYFTSISAYTGVLLFQVSRFWPSIDTSEYSHLQVPSLLHEKPSSPCSHSFLRLSCRISRRLHPTSGALYGGFLLQLRDWP